MLIPKSSTRIYFYSYVGIVGRKGRPVGIVGRRGRPVGVVGRRGRPVVIQLGRGVCLLG